MDAESDKRAEAAGDTNYLYVCRLSSKSLSYIHGDCGSGQSRIEIDELHVEFPGG